VLADERSGRLFIADTNHNRLIVATLEGELLQVIGSGAVGATNGDYDAASFNKPQGMALIGQMLYVADTENHLLRKIDLKNQRVKTIAGRGTQSRNPFPGLEKAVAGGRMPRRWVGPPLGTLLNSPWALWVQGQDLYIAMAGSHQIWKMPLDESEIGPYAGNAREDIIDGPLLPKLPFEEGYASFAQPSGLAGDGTWLYVADSEGSSIRAVPFDPTRQVRTVVGTSHLAEGRLFAFGDIDGEGEAVRFQHVLGVTYGDGKLYVADTYNHKIKEVDPQGQTSRTIAGTGQRGDADEPSQFHEPSGLSYAAGKLYVADTNNHLIRVVDLASGNKVSTLVIDGLTPPALPESNAEVALPGAKEVALPLTVVKPVDGQVRLDVQLELPSGWKINPRAPMSYRIQRVPKTGTVDRAPAEKATKVDEPSEQFSIMLPTAGISGQETMKVSLTYYYCQEGAEGLCKVGSVTWKLPLEVRPSGQAAVPLKWTIPTGR
jgi:DNA-binding beta-propeller fold protein YncE